MKTKAKAILSLTGSATIWGFTGLVSRLLIPYGSAVSITSLRFFLASFVIFCFLLYTKQFRIPPLKHLAALCVLGICFVCLNCTFVLVGLKYSTVSHSALINATSPLFISFFAFLFFKEKLLNIQWLGIAIALLGTLYILTNGNLKSLATMDFNRGDIFFISAQFGWSAYTLLSSKMLKHVSVLELVFWSGLFGAIVNLMIEATFSEVDFPPLITPVLIGLFYTAIITSLGAMILWNSGIKQIGPSVGAIFINLSTVIGVISGIMLLGEPFTQHLFIGALAVFIGIFLLVQYATIANFFKFLKSTKSLFI